ncbi:MAG: NTP transferase domain-containing protein [Clostridia bacterium]|nr:NTP transferase domain-containing protein [Clostridia bacterium]
MKSSTVKAKRIRSTGEKRTLVILAAGIGSRFGGGVKQLAQVGPAGEVIIDYSIHDAIKAGFDKIVFIIRHAIEEEFREVIGKRVEEIGKLHGIKICYAYQEIDDIPIPVPEGRTKPWGTGHALLAVRGIVKEPFAVINADDYYGPAGFRKAKTFLPTRRYGMVGYKLGNTLSDNGGVTRGICKVDKGVLKAVVETFDIVKDGENARAGEQSGGGPLPASAVASMNFWLLPAEFLDELEKRFPVFLAGMTDPKKDEYLLPAVIDQLIREGEEPLVLQTDDRWFGVTYAQDKPAVIEEFRKLYEAGVYTEPLYGDLSK